MSLLSTGVANGTVLTTEQAVKHTIDGVTRTYPVYRIRIDQLRYNNHNDRIATWLSAYRAEHDGSDPSALPVNEYNEIIQKFIVDSNPEAIRNTQRNIAAFGQRVPGVVLNDGLVIDGNRRLTCIRRLAGESHETGWFDAVILPDEVASDPKRIKLLELSIQHGEEGKVDYDPIERLVGVYNDIIKDGLLTQAEYAKHTGMTEANVQKLVDQAKLMCDFLEFCNAPDQYHLARELAIAGPLGELPAILKKCKSDNERLQVKEYVFANIIAQPEGDITRFVRRFKKIVGTQQASDFYGQEQTAFQMLIPAMGTRPLTTGMVRQLRGNERIVGSFSRAMEVADRKVKLGKMVDAPSAKSKEALDNLHQILPSMLRHLDESERSLVRSTLEDVVDQAQMLIKKIDGLA